MLEGILYELRMRFIKGNDQQMITKESPTKVNLYLRVLESGKTATTTHPIPHAADQPSAMR